jgi:hypothetical protein
MSIGNHDFLGSGHSSLNVSAGGDSGDAFGVAKLSMEPERSGGKAL